ncbi:hypothetical protein MKW92_028402 [Papaver armeniacum]|nr:hypothetical protein MKW92_027649 [Papaver armeniacum]KAI3924746.1 hypothetical protein MKW92_028402 [Papaver armeniacum]
MTSNFVVYTVCRVDKRASIFDSSLDVLKFIQYFSLHIFPGKVNGAVGGDSYNVKDDGPSRIKDLKIQSLTKNIRVVYRFVSSLVFDAS